MNEVVKIKTDPAEDHADKRRKTEWRVLVVDKFSMRIVSACTKVHELCEEGITRE